MPVEERDVIRIDNLGNVLTIEDHPDSGNWKLLIDVAKEMELTVGQIEDLKNFIDTNLPGPISSYSSKNPIDFGTITANSGSVQKTITVNNVGSSNLSVQLAITGSSDFTLESSTPLTIENGVTETITLKFTPTATGLLTASLDITGTESLSIALSGTGA